MTLREPDLLGSLPGAGTSWVIPLLLFLCIGTACVIFWIRRKPSIPQTGPHQAALKALKALNGVQDYVELSRILRSYITDRFGVPALKQTPEETLSTVADQLPGELRDQLSTVFESMERVLFSPNVQGNERDPVSVEAFVTATAPEGELMIRFEDPAYLFLLIVPLLWWLRRPASLSFSSTSLLHSVAGQGRARFSRIFSAATGVSLMLLVIALARPQWEEREVTDYTEGIDILLLLDVSSSMSATVLHTRQSNLEVAKEILEAFALSRTSDRVGLITFARYPKLACPLTTDAEALSRMIDPLNAMPRGSDLDGTGLGAALAEAARVFEPIKGTRVVILLTDGEENQFLIDPLIAAKLCAEMKIKVYTVAASREMDTRLHQEIASLTRGEFQTASTAMDLEAVYREINRLEKRSVEARHLIRRGDLYRWLLLPAVILLLLEFFLSRTFFTRIP